MQVETMIIFAFAGGAVAGGIATAFAMCLVIINGRPGCDDPETETGSWMADLPSDVDDVNATRPVVFEVGAGH